MARRVGAVGALLVLYLACLLGLTPASPLAAFDGVITESRVRLREDIWGSQIRLLNSGEQVNIQTSRKDAEGRVWFLVNAGDDSGWVYGDYVRPTLTSRSARPQIPEISVSIGSRLPSYLGGLAVIERPEENRALLDRRVGLQVGHWRNAEAGYPYSTQTGSSWGGHSEAEVNLAIAQQVAGRLEALGYQVDLLPTLIPSGYRADVVVAIHADGGPSDRRGFFADRSADGSRAHLSSQESQLVSLLNQEYAAVTGIPYAYRGTAASRYYYGYYRVDSSVPMALIETGFLTNAQDRETILSRPDLAASGIARAIERFLEGK